MPSSQPDPQFDKPLAVLGGPPAFAEPLHVGRPNIPDRRRFLARMEAILDRRWLTNDGPLVQEFEAELCRRLEVKHCVAMSSGTTALEIAIRALDLKGEVIVPSFTFVATAHALMWQEITPVFCDIDPVRHHLDPARIEELITPRTTGIIGVHLWGRACDVAALEEIGRRRNLKVLFDAAHATGCTYRSTQLGRFGEAEVFSFHATKCVHAFEGGAVTTNDDGLAAKLRLMRNFGFAGYDNVVYLGVNGKMSEASAAMGLTSLEDLEFVVERNRANFHAYAESLAGIPGVSLVAYDRSPGERTNYHYVIALVDEAASGLSRDDLVAVLQAENVLARRYFYPGCHRMEPYRTRFPEVGRRLPITEQVSAQVLVLPTGTSVREGEIRTIGRIVREAVGRAAEVRRALAQ